MTLTPEQTEVVEHVRENMTRAARRPNGSPRKPRARKSERRFRIWLDGKRHQVVMRDGVDGYLFDPLGARRWVPFDARTT